MAYVVPAVLQAQLGAYPTLFSTVGAQATFGSIVAATGNFASVQAATGTFASVNSGGWYNSAGAPLTQTVAVFCGTLASTGAGTQLYNTVVNRGTATSTSGSYVSGLSLSAGLWYRCAFSIAVSTVPASAKMTAQLSVGGTLLPDSTSYFSNSPETSTIGVPAAVAQQATLAGWSHFVPTAAATLVLTVSCSTGTCVLGGGSLELFQMQ